MVFLARDDLGLDESAIVLCVSRPQYNADASHSHPQYNADASRPHPQYNAEASRPQPARVRRATRASRLTRGGGPPAAARARTAQWGSTGASGRRTPVILEPFIQRRPRAMCVLAPRDHRVTAGRGGSGRAHPALGAAGRAQGAATLQLRRGPVPPRRPPTPLPFRSASDPRAQRQGAGCGEGAGAACQRGPRGCD